MGNLRDGGYVVIGIDDDRSREMLPGLSDEELAMWLVYDEVSEKLALYCDPPVSFDLAERTVRTGARVVVIHVHEFADIPHLCARDYERVLRRGAPYVRSRKKPETADQASNFCRRPSLLRTAR